MSIKSFFKTKENRKRAWTFFWIFLTLLLVAVTIYLIVRFAMPSSSDPDPDPTPDPGSPFLAEKFLGCPNVGPENWYEENYDKNALSNETMKCMLDSGEIVKLSTEDLENKTYKLVFSTTGAQIYDDLNDEGKYWYNYGNYTNGQNDAWACMPEPTNTSTKYERFDDALEKELISKKGDSLRITSVQSKNDGPKYRHSVRIHSKPSFVYGIHAFRIDSIPDNSNDGVWPAAWQAAPFNCRKGNGGSENYSGPWPQSGETDIFELVPESQKVSSSLHVMCRNNEQPIQMAVGIDKKPGWYACVWTPKYLQMYYYSIEDGDKIFLKNEIVPNTDLKPDANRTSSSNKDDTSVTVSWKETIINGFKEGADVVDKKVHVDSSADDENWIIANHQFFGNDRQYCKPLNTGILNNPPTDATVDKKRTTFLAHGPEAAAGGGFLTIINVATCPNGASNKDPLNFDISAYRVWQIPK